MIDIILSFLGLKASGFKRQNAFFSLFGRFSTSRFNKKSINYLIGTLFSIFILISDYYYSSYTSIFKTNLAPCFIRTKCFVNELIEFPKIISNYMHLKKENEKLRLELDELKIKIITTKELENDLTSLKNSVNLKYSVSTYKSIEKILGFDKSAYNSFLIISSTQENSKKGGIIISSDGLLGVIFDSYNGIARVMTIADQKLYIPVKSDSGEHFIISGNGKNKMISQEIRGNTQNINIKISDILYTSGEGGVFQAGIPVAKITEIKDDKTIIAEPVVNIDDTKFVWVVSPLLKSF